MRKLILADLESAHPYMERWVLSEDAVRYERRILGGIGTSE